MLLSFVCVMSHVSVTVGDKTVQNKKTDKTVQRLSHGYRITLELIREA